MNKYKVKVEAIKNFAKWLDDHLGTRGNWWKEKSEEYIKKLKDKGDNE